MLDVNCISHTLNDVGTNIKVESLLGFVDKFVAIFKNSAAARRAFHKLVHGAKTSYSRTRWGGFRDIADKVVYSEWPAVVAFVKDQSYGFCAKQREQARDYLAEHERVIRDEAILLHYASKGVYGACYKLEGDGPTAVLATEELETALEGLDILGDVQMVD